MLASPARLTRDCLAAGFSDCFVDVVNKLLDQNPSSRLGCFGMAEVKAHAFFKGFDWLKVAFKSAKPPFVPFVDGLHADQPRPLRKPRLRVGQAAVASEVHRERRLQTGGAK